MVCIQYLLYTFYKYLNLIQCTFFTLHSVLQAPIPPLIRQPLKNVKPLTVFRKNIVVFVTTPFFFFSLSIFFYSPSLSLFHPMISPAFINIHCNPMDVILKAPKKVYLFYIIFPYTYKCS